MPATSSPSPFGEPPTQGAQSFISTSGVHFRFGSGSSGIPQLKPKTAAISTEEKAADHATDGEGSEQATSTEGGESSGSTSNLLAAHNPHDDEGEGEENEISVHAIKVKAYRMKKADAEGNPGWADLGFGERFFY
jgi:nucleoporin NUP2